MSKKEATLRVEKSSVATMSAEDRAKEIAALGAEIETRNREMETKLYIVEGGAETGENLLKFVSEKAQWKFTEAIGVVEMTKEIEDAAANAKGGKQLFLRVLPLEALWFFINKVEGVGLEEAKYYSTNLLKPVGDALARVKADRDAINELMMRQGSLEAGADFEAEVQPAESN
jgi:hypothetical protein